MGNHVLYYDTLEDRKALYTMLAHPRMTDKMRQSFVQSCCRNGGTVKLETTVVRDPRSGYGAQQAYDDLVVLAFQFGVNLGQVLEKLARLLRRLT